METPNVHAPVHTVKPSIGSPVVGWNAHTAAAVESSTLHAIRLEHAAGVIDPCNSARPRARVEDRRVDVEERPASARRSAQVTALRLGAQRPARAHVRAARWHSIVAPVRVLALQRQREHVRGVRYRLCGCDLVEGLAAREAVVELHEVYDGVQHDADGEDHDGHERAELRLLLDVRDGALFARRRRGRRGDQLESNGVKTLNAARKRARSGCSTVRVIARRACGSARARSGRRRTAKLSFSLLKGFGNREGISRARARASTARTTAPRESTCA
eukprot:8132-Pelagococcus_subviridis.AAC.1